MSALKEYPDDGTTKEKIDWIINFDSNALLRKNDYGKIFAVMKDTLIVIQELLTRIDLEKIDIFKQQINPEGTDENLAVDNIDRYIDRINNAIKEALNFENKVNASAVAGECNDRLLGALYSISTRLSPYMILITKSLHQSTTLKQITQEAKDNIAEINAYKEQAAQATSGIASTTATTGIAKEASHFLQESALHDKNAKKWRWVAIGVGMLLLLVAGLFYYYDKPPAIISGTNWNHFIPRFSILGILIFIEVVLISIYKAERHNAIVNKHRANALNTFEAMTAATLAQNVKDAVTLTAAGAIYAPQETGFGKRGVGQTNNAADILKSIADTKD